MNSERGGWITTNGNIITIVLYSKVLQVHKLNPNLKFNSISSSLSEIEFWEWRSPSSRRAIILSMLSLLSASPPLPCPPPNTALPSILNCLFTRDHFLKQKIWGHIWLISASHRLRLHTQCLLVHHYLLSVSDALRIQIFVEQCMKDPSLKAPSVRWRLLTDSQAVGQCSSCAGAPTSLSHDWRMRDRVLSRICTCADQGKGKILHAFEETQDDKI